jgi:hypothetical protein
MLPLYPQVRWRWRQPWYPQHLHYSGRIAKQVPSPLPLPSCPHKRKFVFNHRGEEWFLPLSDESYKSMVELKISHKDMIQICQWMVECRHLRESYQGGGLLYFDNGKPTGHVGVDRVVATIRQRRNQFLKLKRDNFDLRQQIKKEATMIRKQADNVICDGCTSLLRVGQECQVCKWCNTRSRRSTTSYHVIDVPDTDLDNQSIPDSDSDIEESAWEDDKQEEVKERKMKRTPQWEHHDYLSSKDAEYRDAVSKYLKHKTASKKEPLGTVRPLKEEEEEYFCFMSPIYKSSPLLKQNRVEWDNPPKSWILRLQKLDRASIVNVIENIHQIAKEVCQNTPRFKWMETFEGLPPGVSRFVWCLMFCKATNGVSDVVVCKHFKLAIEKIGPLTMEELIENPLMIARILRQTKNTEK